MVNWKISSFPEITRILSISGALMALVFYSIDLVLNCSV